MTKVRARIRVGYEVNSTQLNIQYLYSAWVQKFLLRCKVEVSNDIERTWKFSKSFKLSIKSDGLYSQVGRLFQVLDRAGHRKSIGLPQGFNLTRNPLYSSHNLWPQIAARLSRIIIVSDQSLSCSLLWPIIMYNNSSIVIPSAPVVTVSKRHTLRGTVQGNKSAQPY